MKAGATFLIPDGISTHLSFVIEVLVDGSLVVCHFTSESARCDRTCIVEAGEHPFCKKRTVVRYDQAYICAAERIPNLESVITKRMEDLSAALLARIRKGALDSSQTPDYIKDVLK